MNCRNVEELLPLYVGGDLDETRTQLMKEHVHACIECSRSAREYGETNQLLQAFEPPQFEEATFAAIRSQVLREIETGIVRKSSSSQLFQLLVRPFQPRIMWAVSTAVVLAVCLFAYYFIANRNIQQSEPQRAGNLGAVDQKAQDEQASAGRQNDNSERSSAPTGSAGDPVATATPQQKSRLRHTVWHSRRAGETPAVPVGMVPSFPKLAGAAPTTLAATDKALRLEIQTSDQNIRIIWFSNPSNNEGSPKEFSKGT